MKKSYKLLILAIFVGIAFSTTSCSKCRTCEVVYDDGVQSINFPEVCDDKDAIKQLKDDCEAAADLDPTLTCECSLDFSFQ